MPDQADARPVKRHVEPKDVAGKGAGKTRGKAGSLRIEEQAQGV